MKVLFAIFEGHGLYSGKKDFAEKSFPLIPKSVLP